MLKTHQHDLAALRAANRAAARVLWEMIRIIKPGMTALQLDQRAAEIMVELGARSAPKLTEDFPGYTCISVNDIIAHGIPNHRIFRCGDFVNIDVSIEKDGFFGDVAYTFVLGQHQDPDLQNLCRTAKNITLLAVRNSLPGKKLNEIGKMIEDEARKHGYTVIRNLCSHGVGRSLHEHPVNILNFYDPEEDLVLEEGMVIAWEPYISTCATRAIEWNGCEHALTTHNQSHVAQFEHTVLVAANKPEILTVF
jgi:methionyl aminopeptidase